jgi:hypothetical protein
MDIKNWIDDRNKKQNILDRKIIYTTPNLEQKCHKVVYFLKSNKQSLSKDEIKHLIILLQKQERPFSDIPNIILLYIKLKNELEIKSTVELVDLTIEKFDYLEELEDFSDRITAIGLYVTRRSATHFFGILVMDINKNKNIKDDDRKELFNRLNIIYTDRIDYDGIKKFITHLLLQKFAFIKNSESLEEFDYIIEEFKEIEQSINDFQLNFLNTKQKTTLLAKCNRYYQSLIRLKNIEMRK